MRKFLIGAIVESFKMEFRQAVEMAKKLGVDGLQMYAPTDKSAADCLEMLDIVKSNGLRFSAICGDLGHGYMKRNEADIEQTKRIVDMSKLLETDVITTHVGVIPADSQHPRYKIMQEICHELGVYAQENGMRFAVETGPEPAAVLKEFLDGLDTKGVAVNLDPANFVMVTGDDPVKAVDILKDYIVHTHAKDGVRLRECDPEVVYRAIENTIREGRDFMEVPLGEGDVDFDNYLKALEDIGYSGFLTIEREVGDTPWKDIEHAVQFLRGKI